MDDVYQQNDCSNLENSPLKSEGRTNTKRDRHFDMRETDESESFDEESLRYHRGSRPHSTPLTLRWLEDNYETAEGVCIPRSTLYLHYLDFCEENDTNPVNAASFGKIIRQQFPQITTRRLGTRGQSKYHYYGVGVKESSSYYELIYSAKGVQAPGEGKKETTKQIVAYSPRSKLGTLLPPFPDLDDLTSVLGSDEQKVVTFIMMYRTHCQRILDTVIRANFDEVQNFLHHFWQGMPQHITPILGTRTLIHLVGVCDSILYKAVAKVLMPTVLQPFPESLTQVIRKFANQLEEWLTIALHGMPSGLQTLKMDLARRFSQVLRRQLSVNHLVQAARNVVNSPDVMSQMLSDWLMIDVGGIAVQTLYTVDEDGEKERQIIFNLCRDFEKLLDDQAPLESYITWLDSMVEACVIKPASKEDQSLKSISRQFLFLWTCFGTRVIRDLTLQSAASFGSFHLLHLMFDDYVLYRIESLQADDREKDLLRFAKGETDEAHEGDNDVILPDSTKVSLPLGRFITSQPGSRFDPTNLLTEDMFDYESNSDFFSSDEEDEEDDDENFLRSPFDVLNNMRMASTLKHAQPAIGSDNATSFLGNHSLCSTDHPPTHPHHHHQHPHHHGQHPQQPPPPQHHQYPIPSHSDFTSPIPQCSNFLFPQTFPSPSAENPQTIHPYLHHHHLHHRQQEHQQQHDNPHSTLQHIGLSSKQQQQQQQDEPHNFQPLLPLQPVNSHKLCELSTSSEQRQHPPPTHPQQQPQQHSAVSSTVSIPHFSSRTFNWTQQQQHHQHQHQQQLHFGS